MHFGLGPIGAAVVGRSRTQGVQDRRRGRHRSGEGRRDLGEVAGARSPLKVKVSRDARKAIKASKPDVVVLCTSSSMKKVLPQIETILKPEGADRLDDRGAGLSRRRRTCGYARAIHQLAKKAKVAVLGTGVNPGFVMDALPITLTGVCERVEAIRVDRIQDARIRRLPFQQKIGAGLTREQFQRKVDDGSVRHVGLAESISMIADALGLEARPDHRRDPAEDRDRDGRERVPRRRSRLRLRHRSRTASATATASRSSRCTWRPISARRSRTTRWRSRDRRRSR